MAENTREIRVREMLERDELDQAFAHKHEVRHAIAVLEEALDVGFDLVEVRLEVRPKPAGSYV